jgi:hypothetical protein
VWCRASASRLRRAPKCEGPCERGGARPPTHRRTIMANLEVADETADRVLGHSLGACDHGAKQGGGSICKPLCLSWVRAFNLGKEGLGEIEPNIITKIDLVVALVCTNRGPRWQGGLSGWPQPRLLISRGGIGLMAHHRCACELAQCRSSLAVEECACRWQARIRTADGVPKARACCGETG